MITNQNYFSTASIAAGGCASIQIPGQVLTIKTCTIGIQAALDGGSYQAIQAGTILRGPFNTVIFQNNSSVAVTVSGWVADTAIQFAATDNSAANAQTYCVGNFGQANGASASGSGSSAVPAVNGPGLCQITTATKITMASADPATGHRRQLLTLSVDPLAANTLAVLDANGNTVMILQKGSQISLPVDSVLQLQGVGGTVGVSVGQYYLSAN